MPRTEGAVVLMVTAAVAVALALAALLWLWWARRAARGHTLQVVVARYAEPLDWLRAPVLRPLWPVVVVYNKGADDLAPDLVAGVAAVHRLPNVGRCDHTYLTHLVRGLEGQGNPPLADVTVFVPGCVDAEPRKTFAFHWALWRAYRNLQVDPVRALVWHDVEAEFETFAMDEWGSSTPSNLARCPVRRLEPASPRPFGPWFRSVFPELAGTGVRAPLHLGGVVPAFRAGVRQTPLATYQRLLDQCAHHPNPEVGHYIERVWGLLVDRQTGGGPEEAPRPRGLPPA